MNTFSLRRFFCIHFIAPFIILGLMIVHIILLHRNTSRLFLDLNALSSDKVMFSTFIIKDVCIMMVMVYIWLIVVFSGMSKMFMHPEGFLYARNTTQAQSKLA